MQYRERRRVTTFNVTIKDEWGRKSADIIDVTRHGARVRLALGNLAPETEVILNICGGDHKAAVIWNKEGDAGLRFEKALSRELVNSVQRSLGRVPRDRKRRFLMQ